MRQEGLCAVGERAQRAQRGVHGLPAHRVVQSCRYAGSWCARAGGFKPQFFPRLEGISALFSQPATAASWVLHILAINLVLARSIYLDGAPP